MNSDFKDLLKTLNEAGVKYLVVGGWAYTEHVEPRATKDLDIWIEASNENADATLEALRRFGAPLKDLSQEDLTKTDTIYQLGLPPNRIDIITGADGIDFADCWPRRKVVEIRDLKVNYISASDLLKNKESTGRLQDQADAEHLRESISNMFDS
jgi:hypothetical protein